MGAHGGALRSVEAALGRVGEAGCGQECREELLYGSPERAIAVMSTCEWFGAWASQGRQRPGQAGRASPGFAAEIGGVECRLEAVVVAGELVWLTDNRRSTMRQDATDECRRAVAREIVARVSGSIGALSGRDGQVVAVVYDPMGAVALHGGLEEALGELGRRCAWLSAVALAGGERLEIHGVPGSANPLDSRVREGMLRMHGRRLLAMDAADGAGREG